MKKALDKLLVQLGEADTFPVLLKEIRAGGLVYGVHSDEDFADMHKRRNIVTGEVLVKDDELEFLFSKGLISNLEAVKGTPKRQTETAHVEDPEQKLKREMTEVLNQWLDLTVGGRDSWVKIASEHPEWPEARRILEIGQT